MTNKPSQEAAQAENLLANDLTSERQHLNITAQMHDHVMTVARVPASKFYWDARTFVETFQEVATYYGIGNVRGFADIYNFEIEGMGGKMLYGENAMPTIDFRDPLIKEPEDLHKLKTPDFYHDGRLPYVLDCIKLRKSEQGSCCGPFSMAVGMRGFPALIKDMRKRPEFFHELFTFIIDRVLVPYLKVQKEYCGISSAAGADAWASVPLLSVKEMKEMVVPYNQELMAKTLEFGVQATCGSGDYCEEDPEKFDVEALYGSFDIQIASRDTVQLYLGKGRWQDYPLEPVTEYTARYRAKGIEVPIRAGVNARLLRDGPADKIVHAVRRLIDAFARKHELTIHLANIPADTPTDHVHAAIAAVHTYGRLPIADNLDEIEFKLPKRESFQEWQDRRTENTA